MSACYPHGRVTSGSQVEKKVKKEKEEIIIPLEDLLPIAQPLAQKKMLKKLHKTIKKGASSNKADMRSHFLSPYSFKAATSEAGSQRGREGHP